MTYEEACAEHEWHVPERYNIAADVCDKHPRDKLAMVHEHFDGDVREVTWGELQDLANQAAHVLRRGRASSAATASRSCCRRRPRPRRSSSAPGSSARCCCRCRCSTATTASATASTTPRRRCSSPTPTTRRASTAPANVLVLDDEAARRRARPTFETADTAADDPAQLYYTSGTTGLAKGIVHAHRYLLAHEEFVYCHEVQDGERFHGMGEWAWAAGIAPLLGPVAARRACSASTSARAASTRTSSSTSSSATRSRTSSRRRPRCAR